jgi:hypothetical protein
MNGHEARATYTVVTVRLSLNFIIGCWGYAVGRENRVG